MDAVRSGRVWAIWTGYIFAWLARTIYLAAFVSAAYIIVEFLRYPEETAIGFEGPFAESWHFGTNTRYFLHTLVIALVALGFSVASLVVRSRFKPQVLLLSLFLFLAYSLRFADNPVTAVARNLYAVTGEIDLSAFARCPGLKPTVDSAIRRRRACDR